MSIQEYAERLRNTRTFTFCNVCGDDNGGNNSDIGNFDVVFPPSPFPQDVIASRAIFKLKSFYITEQTDTNRANNNSLDLDNSGFFIQLNGIGLNQGIQSQAKNCSSFTQAFPIYNKDGGSNNSESLIYQRISGGEYYGDDVLCSNPYGTIMNIKIIDMDGQNSLIPNNTNLNSFITFSIELIPDN